MTLRVVECIRLESGPFGGFGLVTQKSSEVRGIPASYISRFRKYTTAQRGEMNTCYS
jgi:hypothetical protein